MITLEILSFLRKTRIYPVSPEVLAYELGEGLSSVKRALRRLAVAGIIPELYRGLYWNPFVEPANNLCLHQVIAPASYVSMLTGMWWHGIIEQRPFVVTCVTWSGRGFSCENEFGRYEFVRLPKKFIFGFHDVPEHLFAVGDPEKVLLDYFYVALHVKKRKPRLVELNLEDLDVQKLKEYAKIMGLTWFLEETGLANPDRWSEFAPRGC
ncbi:Transcriptional regulator, AbiEi antitoxin, Type IV TA system [Thermanaeromonas toyohensis ToBE]|uniref:Transcriptional regulator, AbiEi antitoxin, Type IV TA system n=1 Tax=Thermanaeromonas toyohensis ToBE TaxID=698762 RepID=A0A1W1VS12_9FIRM|nr:hypothetical protein [Thermanaeromonas toyohensis]SMB96165.1 Transcriptional regulator, AbiEi antitoxin, Type IV TA system [Thermanaeromonas toyohensis ToBE]